MYKLLLFLFPILYVCCPAYGSPPIVGYPTATSIRFLKQNLDLNGQVSVLSGTVNPTSVATSAPLGSLYINSSTGNVYRKLDAGSTVNWVQVTAITTSSTAVERIERAIIFNTGTVSTYNQSGNFISGYVKNGTGDFTANFTTAFSSEPSCVCSVYEPTVTSVKICKVLGATALGSVRIGVMNSAGTAVDNGVNLICQGPR